MKNFIQLPICDFVDSMTDSEKLELLKYIIDSYGCVTVKVNKEDWTVITGEDIKPDKGTANECLIIKL